MFITHRYELYGTLVQFNMVVANVKVTLKRARSYLNYNVFKTVLACCVVDSKMRRTTLVHLLRQLHWVPVLYHLKLRAAPNLCFLLLLLPPQPLNSSVSKLQHHLSLPSDNKQQFIHSFCSAKSRYWFTNISCDLKLSNNFTIALQSAESFNPSYIYLRLWFDCLRLTIMCIS